MVTGRGFHGWALCRWATAGAEFAEPCSTSRTPWKQQLALQLLVRTTSVCHRCHSYTYSCVPLRHAPLLVCVTVVGQGTVHELSRRVHYNVDTASGQSPGMCEVDAATVRVAAVATCSNRRRPGRLHHFAVRLLAPHRKPGGLRCSAFSAKVGINVLHQRRNDIERWRRHCNEAGHLLHCQHIRRHLQSPPRFCVLHAMRPLCYRMKTQAMNATPKHPSCCITANAWNAQAGGTIRYLDACHTPWLRTCRHWESHTGICEHVSVLFLHTSELPRAMERTPQVHTPLLRLTELAKPAEMPCCRCNPHPAEERMCAPGA